MGPIPSTPEGIATAAAECARKAFADDLFPPFVVNVKVPEYDSKRKDGLYDLVATTEFAVHLAEELGGKTVIFFKDLETCEKVSNVFDARARVQAEQEEIRKKALESPLEKSKDESDTEELEDPFDPSKLAKAASKISVGEEKPDPDAFRQSLIMQNTDIISGEDSESASKKRKLVTSAGEKNWKLAHVFGNETISKGTDMRGDVEEAMNKHVKIEDDVERIIVLSPTTLPELLSSRRLCRDHMFDKQVFFFNAQWEISPAEFAKATVIYSFLPLLVKIEREDEDPYEMDTTRDERLAQEQQRNARVALLRRYPGPYDLYMDVHGMGYERVDSFRASRYDKKGPTPGWINQRIKAKLEAEGLM